MKIDPTGKPLHINSPNPAHPAENTDGNSDFAKVLGETLNTKAAPSVQNGISSKSVAGPELRLHEPLHSKEWRAADGLLDALEAYQIQLESPGANLKKIEPYVGKMTDLLEDVQPMLDKLPETNPVRGVLQETMVHISKEIERFNMGYYIDG